jgi:GNAT superfamily N-acetyltransferase/predicted nucleic acid-binding protein
LRPFSFVFMKITIKSLPAEVAPFVSEVQKNADSEKDALGFLPASVYDNGAHEGNLYVAVCEENNSIIYAGHLLFRCVFPHARIVQLFVVPRFRGQKVGQKLLRALVDLTEKLSYLHILAGVAADLPANQFYEKMGFVISRTRPGGGSRNRIINIRVKHLDTLDLFKMTTEDAQGLGLVDRLANRQAVYVIDLNVFWDVVKHRPRSEHGNDIVGAAFHRLINLVITREFVRELQRSSTDPSNDPALEFALQLPILSDPEPLVVQTIIDKIAPLVFTAKYASGTMSVRDRSDLVHLAIAIHHSANAFVTSEKAILQASDSINSLYGVEIIHVESLSSVLKSTQKPIPAFRAQLSSDTLYVVSLAQSTLILEAFLKRDFGFRRISG